MAEILPFARSAAHRPHHLRRGGGEVVIFPGVRVEYHDEAPTPPAKKRERRSKRRSETGALSA